MSVPIVPGRTRDIKDRMKFDEERIIESWQRKQKQVW